MLSLLLALFMIWLFVKMGIGLFKIIVAIVAIGITFIFFAYLVIPLIIILIIGGIILAAIS